MSKRMSKKNVRNNRQTSATRMAKGKRDASEKRVVSGDGNRLRETMASAVADRKVLPHPDTQASIHSLQLQSVSTVLDQEANPIGFLASRGYVVGKLLGEGGFAQVYQAKITEKRGALQSVAIKIFDLTNKANEFWVTNCLKNEMYISKNLKHPNIIYTLEVMKTRLNGYIVMMFAARGTISRDIYDNRRGRPYSEVEAKKYFRGLICGLQYMHKQNVAHRDIKLENFLLSADDVPMIGDFGFAACGSRNTRTTLTAMLRKTPCGTMGYMAPELFMKNASSQYDAKAVDIYAMGVSLFEMTNAKQPYPADKEPATIGKIMNQKLNYSFEATRPYKDLVTAMIQIDSNRRPKIDKVVESEWLNPSAVSTLMNTLLG